MPHFLQNTPKIGMRPWVQISTIVIRQRKLIADILVC